MTPPRVDVDFFHPDVVVDPYPYYEEIRTAGRVVKNEAFAPTWYVPGTSTWMITGYDDARSIFADAAHFSNRSEAQIEFFGAPTMMFVDEPDHVRLRRPLARAFSTRSIARLHERVTKVVDGLVAGLAVRSQPFDLVDEFAQKVPMIITSEMLGVQPERRDEFAHWAEVAMTSQSQGGDLAFGAERKTAHEALSTYFQAEIERRRRAPEDDLIGELMATGDAGTMTDAEVLAACILLLAAGLETTGIAIALSLAILGRSPVHRRQLAQDPSLIPSAFEEIMRCFGIAPLVPRVVTKPVEFAGVMLAPGDSVSVLTAAANRDPAHFHDPSVLDFTREPKQHLGFSHGIHVCLGAQLARLEVNVALRALLTALPEFTVTDVDFGPHFAVRGPRRAVLARAART